MLTVYGIPSCGTVKKARAWLLAKNAAHTFIDFRATPPSAAQVRAWVAKFGAIAMRNTSGGAYRALGPEKDAFTDADWTARFIADPMLVKRPIIERDGAPVLIGFRAAERDLRATLID